AAGGGIDAGRAAAAVAAAEVVEADDEETVGVERPARSDQVVPPARILVVGRITAGDMVVAGQRMADQYRVARVGVEFAIGFVHQIVRRQHRPAFQRQRFAEVGGARGDDADGIGILHFAIILLVMSQPFTLQAFGDLVPALGQDVYVHPAATVIGYVVLGGRGSIWPGTVIRGDVNHILIGAGTNVQAGSVLHVSHRSTTDPDGA